MPKTGGSKKKSSSSENSEGRLYNGGNWSLGRFDAFIRSALRAASRRWPVKFEILNAAKTEKKINQNTGRLAQHYRCNICKGEFTSKDIQVDHNPDIGSCETWDEFIDKLFCEAGGLQSICVQCHKTKTKIERENARLHKMQGK